MAKLIAVISGLVLFWSALAMRPGQVFDTATKVAIVSALICGVSIYKDWLNETRAEKRRRKKW